MLYPRRVLFGAHNQIGIVKHRRAMIGACLQGIVDIWRKGGQNTACLSFTDRCLQLFLRGRLRFGRPPVSSLYAFASLANSALSAIACVVITLAVFLPKQEPMINTNATSTASAAAATASCLPFIFRPPGDSSPWLPAL